MSTAFASDLYNKIVSFLKLVYKNKNELSGTSMAFTTMICRFKKSHCLLKSSVPLPQFLCPIPGNFKRRFKRSPNDSGEMFNFFDDWYVYLVSIQTVSVRGTSQRFATNFLPVKIIWNRKNIIIIWARITSRKVSLLRRCRVCITQIIVSMDYWFSENSQL